MTYSDITTAKKKHYIITTPGIHIFYFENKSGELIFTIKNARAKVYIFGRYIGTNDDTYTLSTTQKHIAPKAESHMIIKGTFDDDAQFRYDGMIHIAKDAHGANATLENRNLLLSDTARVISEPALHIIPHDVSCTHAATISDVDTEHIDFLRSRGISTQNAKTIITEGFLQDITNKIDLLT